MTPSNKEELALLKERADDMGITYAANISLDTLRERVNSKLANTTSEPAKDMTLAQKVRNEAMKLVRVRVVCLNPNKKEFEAEFVRFGNSVIPSITRLVPFEVETHIEQCIYTILKNRQIPYIRNEKNGEGHMVPVRKLRSEFQIEVLPPLTKEELAELAAQQQKRQSIK